LDVPRYELIAPPPDNPRRGLAMLPPPSPLDVWFDMEGYPHMEGGLVYLFGATYLDAGGVPQFIDWWAHGLRVGEPRYSLKNIEPLLLVPVASVCLS
jgi:hypothetical protein